MATPLRSAFSFHPREGKSQSSKVVAGERWLISTISLFKLCNKAFQPGRSE